MWGKYPQVRSQHPGHSIDHSSLCWGLISPTVSSYMLWEAYFPIFRATTPDLFLKDPDWHPPSYPQQMTSSPLLQKNSGYQARIPPSSCTLPCSYASYNLSLSAPGLPTSRYCHRKRYLICHTGLPFHLCYQTPPSHPIPIYYYRPPLSLCL